MNPRHRSLPPKTTGFTLTEVAVVMIIVALVLGGMLAPLSAQNDLRSSSETKAALADIRDALFGFAVANGRLPCPASPTIASGDALAGIEELPLSTGCANVAGVIPWATLGLSETDAWGRRYTYVVNAKFTRPPPLTGFASGECSGGTYTPPLPIAAGFALCTNSDLSVINTVGGTGIAAGVPAVVVSHGKNGFGAFLSTGVQIPNTADNDEIENILLKDAAGKWKGAGYEKVFVKKTATSTFDDELIWVPASLLYSRMIAAGKLP